jgi:hypothetical protein
MHEAYVNGYGVLENWSTPFQVHLSLIHLTFTDSFAYASSDRLFNSYYILYVTFQNPQGVFTNPTPIAASATAAATAPIPAQSAVPLAPVSSAAVSQASLQPQAQSPVVSGSTSTSTPAQSAPQVQAQAPASTLVTASSSAFRPSNPNPSEIDPASLPPVDHPISDWCSVQ